MKMNDYDSYEKLNARMSKAFKIVSNPKDWKAPIDKVVNLKEVEVDLPSILESIEFFTATVANWTSSWKGDENLVRIRAAGYRNGPAGDY